MPAIMEQTELLGGFDQKIILMDESENEIPDSGGQGKDITGNEAMTEQPRRLKNPALSGLLVLAVFYTLYFARVFLLPIAAALILYFLLSPVLRSLKKIRVPEFLGAALVLLILLGGFPMDSANSMTPPLNG